MSTDSESQGPQPHGTPRSAGWSQGFCPPSATQSLTIIGSERYTDSDEFREIVSPYLSKGPLQLLLSHGTAGTFKMSQQLANDNSIKFQSLVGDSKSDFEIDESIRSQIRHKCQQILVFVDPKSVQLWDWVNYARSIGKICTVFNIQIGPSTTAPKLKGVQSPYPYSIPGIPMAPKKVDPETSPYASSISGIPMAPKKIEPETSPYPSSISGILMAPKKVDPETSIDQVSSPSAGDLGSNVAGLVRLRQGPQPLVFEEQLLESKPESTTPSPQNTPLRPVERDRGMIKLKIRPPSDGKGQPRLVIRPKITQDWTVSKICEQAVPPGWESVFTDATSELQQISELLETDEKRSMIVPLKKNIFRALEILPMSKVRVIIWGQDPYHQLLSHGEPRAVGLSFSVSREDEVPRSLVNIYQEISNNIPEFVIPKHGDLTSWCRQGVLLLNSSLTCRVNDPNSHAKYGIWLPFIVRLIRGIEQLRPNCVHLLWGKEALKIKQHISERGIVLTASHPSPLSAERGFFGCRHFINVNEILKGFGEEPIEWNLP